MTIRPGRGRLTVQITPRARRDEIVGWHQNTLRVRVTAPPVNGRANAALVRLLATALNVPVANVAVVAGAGGRLKQVEVAGLDAAEIAARLDG